MFPLSSSPLHSCRSGEHYTPKPLVEGARYVLGAIDLDPMSCAKANEVVKAERFFTKEDDGLVQPWFGRVFMNCYGDRTGRNLKTAWRRCCQHAMFGEPPASVLWAGFSLNPLPRLSQCEPFGQVACPSPLAWPTVLVDSRCPATTGGGRIMWTNGATGEPGKQPGHGNYFTLLSFCEDQRARFKEVFGAWGQYIPGLPMEDRRIGTQLQLGLI